MISSTAAPAPLMIRLASFGASGAPASWTSCTPAGGLWLGWVAAGAGGVCRMLL